MLGGDADIRALEHLHPARCADAVHRRDHRLEEVALAQHGHQRRPGIELLAEQRGVEAGELVDLLGHLGDEFLQVGADAEVAISCAGHDRDPGLGILAKIRPGHGEQAHGRQIQGVATLRPVDRHVGDPVPLLVENFVCHLLASSLQRRDPGTALR
jgi:hypothetical protein